MSAEVVSFMGTTFGLHHILFPHQGCTLWVGPPPPPHIEVKEITPYVDTMRTDFDELFSQQIEIQRNKNTLFKHIVLCAATRILHFHQEHSQLVPLQIFHIWSFKPTIFNPKKGISFSVCQNWFSEEILVSAQCFAWLNWIVFFEMFKWKENFIRFTLLKKTHWLTFHIDKVWFMRRAT